MFLVSGIFTGVVYNLYNISSEKGFYNFFRKIILTDNRDGHFSACFYQMSGLF